MFIVSNQKEESIGIQRFQPVHDKTNKITCGSGEDSDQSGLVGFVALRPKSTAMVIAGPSVHLTTLFPGQT